MLWSGSTSDGFYPSEGRYPLTHSRVLGRVRSHRPLTHTPPSTKALGHGRVPTARNGPDGTPRDLDSSRLTPLVPPRGHPQTLLGVRGHGGSGTSREFYIGPPPPDTRCGHKKEDTNTLGVGGVTSDPVSLGLPGEIHRPTHDTGGTPTPATSLLTDRRAPGWTWKGSLPRTVLRLRSFGPDVYDTPGDHITFTCLSWVLNLPLYVRLQVHLLCPHRLIAEVAVGVPT